MNARRAAIIAGIVVVALGLASVMEAAAGQRATDRLTPRHADVDPRVVVVTFASGLGGFSLEVPHLRATYYRDIAVLAARGGARSIAYVDFDSLTFSDGGAGRSNVIGSDELQRLGVGVLHDANPVDDDGTIPFLSGYRVDPLASELAGLGVGTTGDDARTVPGVVRVDDLTDGLIVDTPRFASDAIDRSSTTVVPGLALRLVELGTDAALTSPRADGVMLGGSEVPLEDGELRIAWSDELDDIDDARLVPFGELFSDIPVDLFQDAVVLVGTVDPSKTEYVDTPVGTLPEVLVQANAVNTLLREEWVRPGPTWLGWLAALLGVAGVAVAAGPGRSRRRAWPAVVVAGVVAAVWIVIALAAAAGGSLLPVVLPVVGVVTAALLFGAVRQFDAMAERRRLRQLFSQYVPASVAEQLIASGRGQQASEGERVALTALFCDLRGFTPLAARLEPSQVRELLNVYYDLLAQVIFDDGGTVLQYTGDEIFAVFGAPLPDPDHAPRALACARKLFDRQIALNDALLARGLPPLNYGIGLHSGDAIAAHVGSSVRMQYAVIGDTINVASRHCSLAREGQIMMSDVTKALVGEVADAEQLDGVTLKGVAESRPVHRIQQGPTAASGDPDLLRTDQIDQEDTP